MDAREQRGMQIAATVALKPRADVWKVPSQSGIGTYEVSPYPEPTIAAWRCSCPDFELRGLPCKHIFAVEITVKRETVVGEDGVTVTETATVRRTYTQPWAAYNAAQCAEGDLFPKMLRDLCATVVQPPQGRGRPRLPRGDMIFTAVSRVYADKSARRYDAEVRAAKDEGLTDSAPCFNAVLKYLRDPELTPVLYGLVELSAVPLAAVERDFAADSTGFTTCQHERWYDHKWGKERSRNKWVKLHAMTGVITNVVTSVMISDGHAADTLFLRPLLASTAGNFTMREVSADKAYSSHSNLQAIEQAGAVPYVPFRGAIPAMLLPMPRQDEPMNIFRRMQYLFAYQRDTFLSQYHKRSNVESTFSMIKRKFGGHLRSKSDTGQTNEILCKVIAHNLCVLIAAVHELGLGVPEFSAAA